MQITFPVEYRVLGSIALVLFAIGTVTYHLVEGFSWLDSLYFSVVTLATVGYGDLVPHTTLGKIFTIFYSLAGIGLLVSFMGALSRGIVERRIGVRLHKEEEHAS